MALSFPIIFSLAPMPTGLAANANDFAETLVANLQATISGSFITGQIAGTQPTQNVGPWFDGTFWWAWNNSTSVYQPVVAYASNPTPVINGSMNIWQRNVTFAAVANNTKVADKWKVKHTMASGVATVSRQAINLTGTSLYPHTEYALRIAVTTSEASPGATEYFIVSQAIERSLAIPLFDSPTSFSILLKSSVAGTYCVGLRNSDASQSYVMECVVAQANNPQYFQFPSIPQMPSGSGNWGSLDTDYAYELFVSSSVGSNFQITANAWTGSNGLGTVNQTNLLATNGATLDFTLVQHQGGLSATPYVSVPFDLDLVRCQRYFYKTYPYTVYAGSVSAAGRYVSLATSTNATVAHLYWPYPLRIIPVITTNINAYSPINGGVAQKVYNVGTAADVTITGIVTDTRGVDAFSSAAAFTNGNIVLAHLTVDVDY